MVKVAKYQINPCSAMLPKSLPKTKLPTYWLGSLKEERERGKSGTFKVDKKSIKRKVLEVYCEKEKGEE